MKIPEQFDPIRPFEPDELPDVFDRLLHNEQFSSVLAYFYPRIADATAKAVAEETSRIYDILHCNGIIRIDYIITKDAEGNDCINMLEINTTPGMTATSFIPQQVRAAGLDITQVLSEIVENQF